MTLLMIRYDKNVVLCLIQVLLAVSRWPKAIGPINRTSVTNPRLNFQSARTVSFLNTT